MSLLIRRAVKGERIVLDLHGLPSVVLVPIASERAMMDAFLQGQGYADVRRIATEEKLRLTALHDPDRFFDTPGDVPT